MRLRSKQHGSMTTHLRRRGGPSPASVVAAGLMSAVLVFGMPASTTATQPARIDQVQGDPFFDAWRNALEAQQALSTTIAATSPQAATCGADPALRTAARQVHLARKQLLASLQERGLSPSPPPAGVAPWPWSAAAAFRSTVTHYDKDNVSVLVDDGRMVYINLRGIPEVDATFAAQVFYEGHEDEYEFLALFTNFYSDLFNGQFRAYHLAVQNDIHGLGYQNTSLGDEFSERPLYTNSNKAGGSLQSFLHLNDINLYPDDPDATYVRTYTGAAFMLHELSHRWTSRLRLWVPLFGPQTVLLGRSNVHWSFFTNAGGSFTDGMQWVPEGDGFRSVASTSTFGPLDLYMMGFLSPTELDESQLFYLRDAIDALPPLDAFNDPWNAWSPPQDGVFIRATRVDFDMDALFLANSLRRPLPGQAPTQFNVATLLVVPPDGGSAIDAEISKINVYQQHLSERFHNETMQRGTLDLTVRSMPAHLQLVHQPHGDVELANNDVEIATGIELVQRSLPTTLDQVTATLLYRIDGGPELSVPMQRDGDDVFRAVIPGQPMGARVDYWLRANSVYPGPDYTLPEAAPQTAFSFTIGPDTGAPTIQHIPISHHARAAEPLLVRALIRDTHAVGSAAFEYRLNGGNWMSGDLRRQGVSDIFEARFTLPGRIGDEIDYRIVAMDAAQTTHVSTLPTAGTWKLQITKNLVHDVEQEDPLWSHYSLKKNTPEQWHRNLINRTPGGQRSWKLGPDGSLNPRAGRMNLDMDAALQTPAMRLSPGWSLNFFHRYYLRLSPPDTYLTAVDGALIEWQDVESAQDVLDGRWYPIAPTDGYPYRLGAYSHYNPLKGSDCWAGQIDYWKPVTIDEGGTHLTLSNRMVRFRFRCATTPIIWYDAPGAGWYVDDITIDPGPGETAVSLTDVRASQRADGVELAWNAQDVLAGEAFVVDRSASGSQSGTWQRLAQVGAVVGTSHYRYLDEAAPRGVEMHYRITLVRDGVEISSQIVQLQAIPARFHLAQNTPNPFNPSTRIDFELPESGLVTLTIFDVRGRRVRSLVAERLAAGPHARLWDGTDDSGRAVASGVYLYHLTTRGRTATNRMLLLQ